MQEGEIPGKVGAFFRLRSPAPYQHRIDVLRKES